MKRIFKNKAGFIILFGFLLISNVLFAIEKTKKFSEGYETNKTTKLIVENKFGNVNLVNWEENRISIEVEVKVSHSNEKKAQDIIDNISVSFSKSGNEIKAITEFNNGFSDNSWSSNNSELNVDYHIKAPAYISADFKNRYGNIYIDRIDGHANLDLRYGNLKVNQLTRKNIEPLNQVNLAYSNGSAIESCEWLKADISYSELGITRSKAIIFVSKYSKLRIEESSSLVTESRYDTYTIGSLSNFVSLSGYTNFKIEEISNKLSIESKYSDCKVNLIPAGFEEINIENKYGNYRISISPEASYKIEGEAAYADIVVPDGPNLSRIKENTKMSVFGQVGNDENTASVVKINTRYGTVKLRD